MTDAPHKTSTTREDVEALIALCTDWTTRNHPDNIRAKAAATLRALLDERDAVQPAGWIFFNPDTGIELSEQHPIDSGECPDATRIWPANAPTVAEFLKEAWEANRETQTERDVARARIEELSAEVERMQEVLRWIIANRYMHSTVLQTQIDKAVAALAGAPRHE